MKNTICLVAIISLCCQFALGQDKKEELNTAKGATYMSEFERDFLYEVNFLRNDPKNYIKNRFASQIEGLSKKVKNGEKDRTYYITTIGTKRDTTWFDRNQKNLDKFEVLQKEFEKYSPLPPLGADEGFFKLTSQWRLIRNANQDTLGYHMGRPLAESYSTAAYYSFYPEVLTDKVYATPKVNQEILDGIFIEKADQLLAIHEVKEEDNTEFEKYPYHFFLISGYTFKKANLLYKNPIEAFSAELGQFVRPLKEGTLIVGEKSVIKLTNDNKKVWLSETGSEISSFCLLADEGVITGGIKSVGKKKSVVIVKVSPNGDKLWEKPVAVKQGDVLALAEDPNGKGFWAVVSERVSKKESNQTLRLFDMNGTELGKYKMSLYGEIYSPTLFSQDVTLIADKEAGLYVFGATSNNTFEGMLYAWGNTGIETMPVKAGTIEESVFDREYANFIVVRNPKGGFYAAYASNSEVERQEEFKLAALDEEMFVTWSKEFGGTLADGVSSLVIDQDANLYMAGFSYSGVSGDKSEPAFEKDHCDVWVVKVNEQGTKIWDKTITGPGCILSARLFLKGNKVGVVFREETYNMISVIEEK